MSRPSVTARWAGGLALLLVVLGPFSMLYVPGRLVVPGDAAATASRIAAGEALFRLGMLSDVAIVLVEVVLTALLFVLFERVHPLVARVAAFARLAMAVVQAVNVAGSLAVLGALGGGLPPEVLMVVLGVHEQVVHVWEALFAVHCLALGYLALKSGMVPRVLGPLMAVAGVGYLANGLGNLGWPQGKAELGAFVAATSVLGELPFFLWLAVRGVQVGARPGLIAEARAAVDDPTMAAR